MEFSIENKRLDSVLLVISIVFEPNIGKVLRYDT